MAKVIGKAKVQTVEPYKRKDGTEGCRCVAFDDTGNPLVFYRPSDEHPEKESVYNMVLGYDRTLNAVVRYEKVQ